MARWTGMGLAALAVAFAVTLPARAGTDDQQRRSERNSRVVRLDRGDGHLGVVVVGVTGEEVKRLGLSEERGALVKRVAEKSPAAEAGVKVDDVIVAFEGEKVRSASHLTRLVRGTPAGREISLTVVRGGTRQDLRATLDASLLEHEMLELLRLQGLDKLKVVDLDKLRLEGLDKLRLELLDSLGDFELPELPEPPEAPEAPEPPEAPEAPEPPEAPEAPEPPSLPDSPMFGHEGMGLPGFFGSRPRLGIQVMELTEQLAHHFKVDDGLLVSSVNVGSPADKAGLRAGDVIVKVDGDAVRHSRDLVRRVGRYEERELTLGIQRDGRALDVKVHLDPREPRRPSGPTT